MVYRIFVESTKIAALNPLFIWPVLAYKIYHSYDARLYKMEDDLNFETNWRYLLWLIGIDILVTVFVLQPITTKYYLLLH